MVNRKKRLKRAIESLRKRKKEHLNRIEQEKKKLNYSYALVEYWKREVKSLTSEEVKKEKLLKKIK